ncbi:MAG TPA: CopG family transcriptional regulator [Gemmatimonadaceae bacterium]|nr:CopG family transcriptional regulator [Gemmatimonadaceae bacterium]
MKDAHLTLRLPADLAALLDRRARERDTGRSQLVREAVAGYLAGPSAAAPVATTRSGRELAARWGAIPRLDPEEAEAFGADVAAARESLPIPVDAWS